MKMIYIQKLEKNSGELEFSILGNKTGTKMPTMREVKDNNPWLLLYLWSKYPKCNQICFLDCYALRSQPEMKQILKELMEGLKLHEMTPDDLKEGEIKFFPFKIN